MATEQTSLVQMLGIRYPILMAPMFRVSNADMVIAALKSGITAAIPALNYRTKEDFYANLQAIKAQTSQPFGINLIVNKSNYSYHDHLDWCIDLKVPFIITSLGNPDEVIKRCKPLGMKVFCDVVDLNYAQKVEGLGADAVIAVNNMAGGHCGALSPEDLTSLLIEKLSLPVIVAGGIARSLEMDAALRAGAAGVSIGTRFIASTEAHVPDDYKNSILKATAEDIILVKGISGASLTMIDPKIAGENPWCAGKSVAHIHEIASVSELVHELISNSALMSLENPK